MKEPSGRPGLIEQWTHRDFDADTVMALLTAVLALGLGINLSTVWLDTGTLVAGLFLAVALLAAHAHGVDLLGLVRSMPERLNRRPRAMDLDGYQETPRVPPYAQATPPMGHRPPGVPRRRPPDQPRRTDENGTREETSHPAADAAPEPGKGPRAVPLTGAGPAAVHASVSPKTSADADRTERSQDEATATSPGTAATPDGLARNGTGPGGTAHEHLTRRNRVARAGRPTRSGAGPGGVTHEHFTRRGGVARNGAGRGDRAARRSRTRRCLRRRGDGPGRRGRPGAGGPGR
ncbi:hypothetical protein ACFSTC_50895 [Nonomuraea ferruginea]